MFYPCCSFSSAHKSSILEVNLSVKLKTRTIPDFIHNQYSTEYQPREYLGAYKPLAGIYLLRLAIGLQKQLSHQSLNSLFTGNLAKLTGLTEQDAGIANMRTADETLFDDETQPDKLPITKAKLVKEIRKRLKQLINTGIPVNAPVFTNLKEVTKIFGLTATDQEILALKILMYLYPDFKSFLNEHWPDVTDDGLYDYLHLLTVRPIADIQCSLAVNNPLQKLGWISLAPLTLDFDERLTLPPAIFNTLLQAQDSIASTLDSFFKILPPNQLTLTNNVLLQQDLDVIKPLLQAAIETKQTGINILIHAEAGAETVEFVNVVTQSLGASLVKINDLNPDGTPMPQKNRLLACQLTQGYLQNQSENSVILIDAAENLFAERDDWFSLDNDNPQNIIEEASLIRQLQSNPVPIFWLFNRPVGIAPQIFRHFTYTWAVSSIPVDIREQLIKQATNGLNISPQCISQLAKQTDIQIEQISGAATVAKLSQQKSPNTSHKVLLHTLNARRRLYKQTLVQNQTKNATEYNLKFINTDINLPDLIEGLRLSKFGNFCFYGAPGTGKTAFAKYIAKQLGLVLLIKRASDLIDKYVGESEKNIAKMFAEAQKQGAILLLDEADSLLSDRRDAHRRWEVSQVNEMLTQMESFDGIFICTTNLMEKLDAASLRRFDFKVKFDYLDPNQRWELFEQENRRMGTTLPNDAELKQQVQQLTQLTPGDFAVTNRRAKILGKPLTPEHMLSVLRQECEAKGEQFSRIGFVH
jgi:transitional endoplasmic reticulum ATPase